MAERKSSRSRKPIKYDGFDDESDDDFAESKPSKSKKQKITEEDSKKRRKEKCVENIKTDLMLTVSDEPSSIKKRKSLTDKMYEKELEEALQLSVLDTTGSPSSSLDTPASSTPSSNDAGNNMQVEVELTFSKAPELTRIEEKDSASTEEGSDQQGEKEPPSLLPIIDPSRIGTVEDDNIECIEDKGQRDLETGRRQQRRVTKKPVIVDDDEDETGDESDFNPGNNLGDDSSSEDVGEGSEEDFSPDDDDSDFDDGRKKNAKGKENKKDKSTPPMNKTKKSPPAKNAKPAVKKHAKNDVEKADTAKLTNSRKTPVSILKKDLSTPKSSPISAPISTPITSSTTPRTPLSAKIKASVSSSLVSTLDKKTTERLSQSWKAPGPASEGRNASTPVIKSPSSGLRLGLSRNQRVKSLHSGDKVL